MSKSKWSQYCDGILSGKTVSGELMKLSVESHLNDLDKVRRKDSPFIFSEAHANHAIDFMEKMRHVKGKLANQHFKLSLHQHFITAVIFGWLKRHEDTGDIVRRFSSIYRENARKEGKTAWMSTIGNYMTYGEGEQGAEVYSAATKLEQARIVHKVSRSMTSKFVRDHPVFKKAIEILKDNVSFTPSESFYEALPATSDKLDGLNPYAALIDEYHEHPTDELVQVLETGMGSRLQPLLIIITTAGFKIFGPCYKMRSNHVKILKGITSNDSTAGFIFSLDEEDDWHDEENWIKSNPNIGVTPYWSYMRTQYKKAVQNGSTDEVQFKTKNLNMWVGSGDTWIKDEEWMASCKGPYDEKLLNGRSCYLGLDLSTNKDLTSIAAVFPPTESDPITRIKMSFFCPADSIPERSKSDRVDYDLWALEGYIIATPGKVVDYKSVFAKFKEYKDRFNVIKLAYDPKFAYQLVNEIEAIGIDCEAYGQNTRDMNAPIQEIERRIMKKELDHGHHPILRWNVSNVMLYRDSNGAAKFDKRKVVDRIDGCVALAMAMGEYLSEPQYGQSKYETEDLFPGL